MAVRTKLAAAVEPLLRASSALATSPITSLSSQRTRRTPPRPLLAAVALGHRCRGRSEWLCARPGQPGPPLVLMSSPTCLRRPLDTPRSFSDAYDDHRHQNQELRRGVLFPAG